jgi:hypothetical protein
VRGTIKSYGLKSIADLQTHGTVWLLAVTAVKRPPPRDGAASRSAPAAAMR